MRPNPVPPVEQDVSEKTNTTDLDREKQSLESPTEMQRPYRDAKAQAREIAGWQWFLVVLAIYSSQFLFALDNPIVANAQPGNEPPRP
ncbi:hypothetical protein EYZ11_009918 [Aspergillus tanneri]|uniref:Major facilitator superfamily (MFS) profile domain-containing protein n=1 Tax=Aspergillus tanneri TaxID=1220188 RepID=A0A4S3J6V3_9EURO|nr:uncharacterized protein ATNIH1004_011356 [Aspergillus tanneri]KAA8642412.1 hypothetical protein ATNIH1004_011356 [Aspergillus tanneri]THC90620.1 hypothetical protein EYZ11_009918 [Aspergillus tanneri]